MPPRRAGCRRSRLRTGRHLLIGGRSQALESDLGAGLPQQHRAARPRLWIANVWSTSASPILSVCVADRCLIALGGRVYSKGRRTDTRAVTCNGPRNEPKPSLLRITRRGPAGPHRVKLRADTHATVAGAPIQTLTDTQSRSEFPMSRFPTETPFANSCVGNRE